MCELGVGARGASPLMCTLVLARFCASSLSSGVILVGEGSAGSLMGEAVAPLLFR